MEKLELSKIVKSSLNNKIKYIETLLIHKKNTTKIVYTSSFTNSLVSETLISPTTLNQTLTEAILNSMAALVDYYCIYCMINIGIDLEKIKQVQYIAIGKRNFLSPSNENCKNQFESGNKIITNLNNYWLLYMSSTIYKILNQKYGFFKNSNEQLNEEEQEKIAHYHYCMEFLYCNKCCNSGIKYNIYADINKYLKHNGISYLKTKIHQFEKPDQKVLYTFFELQNDLSIFLNDGILKKILELDFNKVKENLKFKYEKKHSELCKLEQEWGIGEVIKVDKENPFISEDQKTLYFFVDNVFFAKTKTSILIDSETSLESVLSFLIKEINRITDHFDFSYSFTDVEKFCLTNKNGYFN